jgi:hypothetical protein
MEIYSGIDYGHGLANIDNETGIRYGVIYANDVGSNLWEILYLDGTDLDYQDAMDAIAQDVESAIRSAVSDYAVRCDFADLAQTVLDSIEIDYESTGDCARYAYESSDGSLAFHTGSDGSVFVTKSPFYALCSYCSPCAPGAGYLASEGNVKAYCLPPDWFDSDNPAPYEAMSVGCDDG